MQRRNNCRVLFTHDQNLKMNQSYGCSLVYLLYFQGCNLIEAHDCKLSLDAEPWIDVWPPSVMLKGSKILTLFCLLCVFQEQLQGQDFSKFQPIKSKLLDAVDDMLANDIAQLMVLVRQEESHRPVQMVKGGAFEGTLHSPFGHGYGEGAGEGIDDANWVVARDKPMYDEIFYTLSPVDGKITGANAKKELVKSKLPNTVLGKIWKLSDINKDGMLDEEEFALANHLIKVKLEGHELPNELPIHLIPPSKRNIVE